MIRTSDKASEVEAHRHQTPWIVIVGGGFAGIAAARALRRSKAEIVLIDRRNHHIFQPLLCQVATAILTPKPRPFWYSDRGNMAVVGRNFAILESGRICLGGFIAFWIWAFIHLMSLP
jgi:NADH dehydrogenase FAD-containing subunit